MFCLTPRKTPLATVQPSTDSPASRVEWHLACIQAKALGNPLPPPPWETPQESAPPRGNRISESLKELRAPKQRERPRPMSPEIKERREKRAVPSKTQGSTPLNTTPPTASKEAKPLAPSEPRSVDVFAGITLPPRSPLLERPAAPRSVHVAMVEEKLKLVSSLLLRAGVPADLITRDNRAQAVIDNFTTYLRAPIAQTLYRYDFGRQFVTRGDVGIANRAANIVLPLLLAETKRDLAVRFSQAELEIQQEILPVNLP